MLCVTFFKNQWRVLMHRTLLLFLLAINLDNFDLKFLGRVDGSTLNFNMHRDCLPSFLGN